MGAKLRRGLDDLPETHDFLMTASYADSILCFKFSGSGAPELERLPEGGHCLYSSFSFRDDVERGRFMRRGNIMFSVAQTTQ